MTRADLATAASAELAEREHAYPAHVAAEKRTAEEAARSLAAWRAVVELMKQRAAVGEDGRAAGKPVQVEVEPILGETAAIAWAEVVTAVEKAVSHRFALACRTSSADVEHRLGALREIRSLVLRSAIRAGAIIPAPTPEQPAAPVGQDGPPNTNQEAA